MLIFILVESALETIPRSLWNHPVIKKYSKKYKKHPQFILLDRSYHHTAMKTLSQSHKRGRPDIVHFALLEALGSPLSKEGGLQVYVHTVNNHIITVKPQTRLPRNYNRYVGLIEQLFNLGRVPQTGPTLFKIERKTLPQLLYDLKPTFVAAFSRIGTPCILEGLVSKLATESKPAVFVGGFPHGHFSKSTIKLTNTIVSIDPEMLETWTIVSRIIYEYERAISLHKKRLCDFK